jgi:hypothetical protein
VIGIGHSVLPVVRQPRSAERLPVIGMREEPPGLRRSSYFIHLENGPAVQSSHDFGVNRPQERDAVADERQVAAAAVLAFVGFDFLNALPKFRRSGRSA